MDARTARTMARYNQWMNERIYEICAQLSDEDRKRDAGAFFKSIHGTLNHVLVGDKVWYGRFTGTTFAFASLAQELHAEFADLRADRAAMDRSILEWAQSLTDEDLESELSYTSAVKPQARRYPMWFAVAHFFNHQAHHRGQLTTLLSQRGIDPGVTDLIWLPELQGGAK